MKKTPPVQYTVAKYYPVSEALIGSIEAMKQQNRFAAPSHYEIGYRHAIDDVVAYLRKHYG